MLKYLYRFFKNSGLLTFLERIRILTVKIEKHDLLILKKKSIINVFFGTFGGISILIRNHYINIDKRIYICNYEKILKDLNFTFKNKWFNKDLEEIIILSVLEALILENDFENSVIEYPNFISEKKYVCNKKNNLYKNYYINKAGGFFHFYLEVIPKLINYKYHDINLHFVIENMSFYNEILDFYKIDYFDNDVNTFKNMSIIKMNKFYPSIEEIIKLNKLNKEFKLDELNTKKIYITRQNERARRISNEKELIIFLKTLNFEIIDPGTLSFNDQIRFFRSADIIISPHGAALSNIVWCNQNTKIIELNGDKDVRWHFAKVAHALKNNHIIITGKTINSIYFETPINAIAKVLNNF
jgi:hypothetical protein